MPSRAPSTPSTPPAAPCGDENATGVANALSPSRTPAAPRYCCHRRTEPADERALSGASTPPAQIPVEAPAAYYRRASAARPNPFPPYGAPRYDAASVANANRATAAARRHVPVSFVLNESTGRYETLYEDTHTAERFVYENINPQNQPAFDRPPPARAGPYPELTCSGMIRRNMNMPPPPARARRSGAVAGGAGGAQPARPARAPAAPHGFTGTAFSSGRSSAPASGTARSMPRAASNAFSAQAEAARRDRAVHESAGSRARQVTIARLENCRFDHCRFEFAAPVAAPAPNPAPARPAPVRPAGLTTAEMDQIASRIARTTVAAASAAAEASRARAHPALVAEMAELVERRFAPLARQIGEIEATLGELRADLLGARPDEFAEFAEPAESAEKAEAIECAVAMAQLHAAH